MEKHHCRLHPLMCHKRSVHSSDVRALNTTSSMLHLANHTQHIIMTRCSRSFVVRCMLHVANKTHSEPLFVIKHSRRIPQTSLPEKKSITEIPFSRRYMRINHIATFDQQRNSTQVCSFTVQSALRKALRCGRAARFFVSYSFRAMLQIRAPHWLHRLAKTPTEWRKPHTNE